MIQLERRLAERYPHWFRGRRARIAKPLLHAFGHWSRLDAISAFLAANASLRGFAFVQVTLGLPRQHYLDAAATRREPVEAMA